MRVLVVDDSRAMRRIMKKALAFAGLESDRVMEAEHGAAALELVRDCAPELMRGKPRARMRPLAIEDWQK